MKKHTRLIYRNKLLIAVAILALGGISEIYLRYYWGFCNAILYNESDKFEYIAKPNQNRFRFRHHILYNKYSMRSDSLKSSDKIRILGFGDSVLNGGVQIDQDFLATNIIEQNLENMDARCFNISCGSWGPDNCFAYLKEYGDFNANLIFLVVSSHDSYDNMNFEKIVNIHPNYPSKQYKSAIYELFDRYAIPRIFDKKMEGDHIVKGTVFNSGFYSFYLFSKEKEIPFLIYLHPDKREMKEKKYNEQGDRIIRFCEEYSIPILQGIEYENETLFRDEIHLNEQGQRILGNALLAEIKRLLSLY
jgi:hypothetical protein